MPAIQIADLNNAKTDVDHIADFANSESLTAVDRLGRTKRTLAGIDAEAESRMDVIDTTAATQRDTIQDAADLVLAAAGYATPVAYTSGLDMTLQTQTVTYNGETYAPKQADLPFTTSGTFESAKFRLIQGVSGADLAASTGAALTGSDDGASGARWTTLAGFVSYIRTYASALFGRVSLLAGSATNLLIRDQSAGATRVHIEPNGHPSGTRSKLDHMFDPYESDGVNYRIINRFAHDDHSLPTAGYAFDGVKAVGNHFGIWPRWHLGFSDAGSTAVPMTLYYFDTSDSSWRTPFKGAWRSGKAVVSGDYVTASNKLYQSGTTGNCGATVPSHAAGTVSDGTISWTFVRDYGAASGSIKPVVLFGERDDLPKFGLSTVRVQYACDTATWNGKKHGFLDSTGAVVWNVYTPVGTDDLYIENAAGTKRLRLDATGEFIQITGLSIAASGSNAGALDTTPSIKGVRLLTFGNASATTVTAFDDGIANQEFYVRSSNGNTTLQHSASIVLAGGVNKTLSTSDVLLFMMNTAGTVATQVT